MKSYELKSTQENIEYAFKKDLIGRNENLFDFLYFLSTIEDDCSIALEGYWGSGKTFFVKQMEMIIKAYNSFIEMDDDLRDCVLKEARKYTGGHNNDDLINQVPIYYDSWLYDNESDPILSLVYSILETFESDIIFKNIEFNKDIIRELFNNILSSLKIKFELPKLINSENWLSDIQKSRDIYSTVKEFLDKLLEERGDRLVIFIDELDRCSPEYAVRLLERIKHYFNNDRITFVFSVNLEQLQHTIKNHYGASFEASRYLDRFFDLRLSLPAPNKDAFYNMIEFDCNGSNWDSLINESVMNYFNLEFREILKYFRTLQIINNTPIENVLQRIYSNNIDIYLMSTIMMPIMVALKITDINIYNAFTSGKREDIFIDVYSESYYEELFRCFLNDGEMFEDDIKNYNANSNAISYKSLLRNLYLLVFSNNGDPYCQMGKIVVHKNIKERLLNKISLINKTSNYKADLSYYN